MALRIRRFTGIGLAAVLLGALLLLGASCGFSEEDLRCQRAGAHLVDCCPGYPIDVVSCGVQLSGETSRCILSSSCVTLTEYGVCGDVTSLDNLASDLCP